MVVLHVFERDSCRLLWFLRSRAAGTRRLFAGFPGDELLRVQVYLLYKLPVSTLRFFLDELIARPWNDRYALVVWCVGSLWVDVALPKAFIVSDMLEVGDPSSVRAPVFELGCSFDIVVFSHGFGELRRSCTVRGRVEVCSLGA